MKRFILFFALLTSITICNAQLVTIVDESFEHSLSGWTITPSGTWEADTNLYAGGHTSFRGYVPIGNSGDTVILTSPLYDFKAYSHAYLTFSHICKVAGSDICQIEYRENTMSSTWQAIPRSSYKGEGIYTNETFNHNSYLDWIPSDYLASPTNSWWKTEAFDISNEVSYAEVQFRFKITKGSVIGSQFAYGWLIDNFKLTASVYEINPPVVEFLTIFSDTVFNTGPFTIDAKVATRTMAPIIQPVKLYVAYTYNNNTTYDTIPMSLIIGDSIYRAIIPQKVFGTAIAYSVYGEDTVGNKGDAQASFVLKRSSGGTGSDSTQIGILYNWGAYEFLPFNVSGDGNNNCTRTLYLSSQVGNTTEAKMISGLSYYLDWLPVSITRYNSQCYLKATNITDLPGVCSFDPIGDGATKVFEGTWSTRQGWNKFTFDKPFVLPPGSNLMVYWIDTSSLNTCNNTGGEQTYWEADYLAGNICAEISFNNFNCDKTDCWYDAVLPITVMYFGATIDDSNSVAMHTIESPQNHVVAGQTYPIVATIKNKGYANLDSCIITYSVNGVVQTPFYWKGSLPDDFNSIDTIGSYVPRLNEYDTILVWVSMPNGVVDSTTYDDTLQIITYGCSSPLSGDYVVGIENGADFTSVNNFLHVLNLCGASGNITLKLQNGIYEENITLSYLSGLMGNNTLTITSLYGCADSVTIRPLSDVGITLSNTSNVVIDGITVDAATNANVAIRFSGDCNNIVIRNNKLYAEGNVSSSSYYVIQQQSRGLLDNISIVNNYIDGGYYAIYLYGKGSGIANYNTNIYIDSNEITNGYYYQLYSYYTSFKSISNNIISTGTTIKAGTFYGIYLNYNDIKKLCNNKLFTRLPMTSTIYSIYAQYLNTSTTGMPNALIGNNEIKVEGSSTTYGMRLYYANVDVIHNSIYVNSTTTNYGVYSYGGSTSYIHNIKNNNIVCATYSSSYPTYINGTAALPGWTMDYNNYYAPNYVGYCGGAHNTMAAWQSATSQDLHSVRVYPTYFNLDRGLLIMNDNGIQCPLDSMVMFDIRGISRDTITSIGAYHYKKNNVDVYPSHVISPLSSSVVGISTPLTVSIYNLGVDTITSMHIGWEVNGVVQTPFSWTGSLATDDTVIVTIGNFIPQLKNNTIIVYTFNPNSTTDEDINNDTIIINTYGCKFVLSGTYTVGGFGADFIDINEVMETVQYCGVSGPVVFKLASGNYGNMVFNSPLPGASKTNTVTFTSASGNANDVVIGSTGEALSLTDAENLVFSYLTFGDTVSNKTTYTIHMQGMCYNIEINACNVYTDITTNSSNYIPIRCYNRNQSKYLRDIRILNNNIRGGYYNMYMYYISGNSSSNMPFTSVTIDGNTLSDAYYSGIYTYYYGRYPTISNNIIKSRVNTPTTYYAIYSYYYTVVDSMQNNKIYIVSNSGGYGIRLYAYQNHTSSYGAKGPMYVANNEIIMSCKSTAYGMYLYSSSSPSHISALHNSIYINNTTTTYGIYLYPYTSSTTSYHFYIYNNNVFLNTTSTGHLLSFGNIAYAATGYCKLNYNNYYKPSGTTYYGSTSYTSLSAWQSAYSQDLQSTNVNPYYNNPMEALIPTSNLLCPVRTDVPRDIVGNTRTSATNNQGCYAMVYDLDAGIQAFVSPSTSMQIGTNNTVSVKLRNFGNKDLTSVVINWDINGVTQTPVNLSGLSLPRFKDTIVNLGSYFTSVAQTTISLKAWTSSPNSGTDNYIYNDTAYIFPFVCDSALNGTYTVGTGGDFPDVNTATQNIMYCGVSGPVTLALLTGAHSSIVINKDIPGSNINNTVTFTSATGNASDVAVYSNGTALLLQNTGNLIFKNITIGQTSSSTTYGVEFKTTCENIIFHGCNINSYTSATSSSYSAVRFNNFRASDFFLKDIYFIKNNINGGYSNFYFNYPAGSSANMGKEGMSVTIDSNTLTNSYHSAIYSNYYGCYPSISYNTITSRSSGSTTTTWYGMYLYLYHNIELLVGNKIKSTNASIYYPNGIYIMQYYNYTSYFGSGKGLIANNEIILNTAQNSSPAGIYFYLPYSNVQLVHNSVYMYGTGSCRGIYTYNSSTTASYIPSIKNNIFVTTATGTNVYPIYYSGSYYDNRYFDVNYNNYYSTGSNIGYAGSAVTSLANLRMLTQQDANSLSEDPYFINLNVDLHTNGKTMIVDNLVNIDIDGVFRPKITNMGCYHDYVPLSVDLKLEAILSPAGRQLTPHVQIPIKVLLYNLGGDTITSCQIEWKINNVAQTTFNWTGSLAYLDTISVQIGTYTFPSGQSFIEINTSLPNQGVDNNLLNDSIAISIVGCDSAFAGIYTVGNTTSDFATLEEAFFMIQECGLSSSVEFQLESGTYESLYLFGSVPGTESSKTITISSVTGNPNSVVIRNSTGGIAMTLNNAQYLRFKYITIGATDNTTTYGVYFAGKCQDIEFYGCNIYSSTTATTSSYAAVYFNGPGDNNNNLTDVRFIKNNISGGYYNMYFYHGGGSVSTTVGGRTTIDSNILSNAYYAGVYTYCIWYFPSISYNKITNRASNSTFYGLYIYYFTTVDTLQGNKVHISNANGATYGIYVHNYINERGWGTGGPLCGINNEVIITNATSTVYGIYTAGASLNTKADFLFNSVYISSSSTTYGLWRGYCDATYKSSFQNNNVYVTNPSGTVYLLYVYSSYESPNYGLINNNNYYRIGSGTTYYGTSSYTSLAAWRNAYSQDANSINVLPSFINSAISLEMSDYSSFLCPNPGVLTDINKVSRSSITTIGAYTTFIYDGKNAGLMELVEPVNKDEIGCYQDFANVRFIFGNRGIVETEFYATPITFRLRVNGPVNYQKDSVLTFGKMSPTKRDTFTITNLLPVGNSGTYNITLWMEMQGDGYRADDTLRGIFIVDKVSIPYSTNFDSVPKGLKIEQLMGSSTWTIESGDGHSPDISPINGTGRLQFSSATGLGSIGTLTFQPFNLKGTVQPQFKLWYAHDNANPSKKDYTLLKISVDGGNTYQEILRLQRYHPSYNTPTFVRYELDLSPYTSYSCVIFSLEGGSYAGGNQNIDSLVIISKQDISLALNIPEQSDFVACELDNQVIEVNVVNLTSQMFDFNQYPSQINVVISGAVDSVFQIPLINGHIPGDTSITYEISNTFDFSTNGTYNIMAYLDAADDNYLNDTIQETRLIQVDANLYNVDSIGTKEIGDTVYPTIYICNNGNIPIQNIPLNVYINNILTLSVDIDTLLSPGDSIVYSFDTPFIVPIATEQQPFYQFRAEVDLACDGIQSNNVLIAYNNVHIPSTFDLSINSINYPTLSTYLKANDSVQVKVYIQNTGNVDIEEVIVQVEVDSAGVVIASFSETTEAIVSETTLLHTFATKYRVPEFDRDSMSYDIRVYLEATEGDLDLTNDTMGTSTYALNDVNIDELGHVNWSMEQNIPNPASAATHIPYSIPQEGVIRFTLTTITGQVLHSQDVPSAAGSHSMEFDTQHLAGGIYYYSMEYQGQRIVKKMTIQK